MTQTFVLPAPLPTAAAGSGSSCTLADVEDAISARVGPWAALLVKSAGDQDVQVEVLRSTEDLGGWTDLWAVRRDATNAADRFARVAEYLPGTGTLRVDRTYQAKPVAGATIVLQHLAPDLLRRVALAGLARCALRDGLVLTDPDPLPPGWEPLPAGNARAAVDLTARAPWLLSSSQILGVLEPSSGQAVPGLQYLDVRGQVLLVVPAGVPAAGLEIHAWRPADGLVDGDDTQTGPTDWGDVLSVPCDYPAGLGHAEAWRLARTELEAVAAEGRQATQAEAAAEATRAAVRYAPWLFTGLAGYGLRAARIAPLIGLPGAGSLGGTVWPSWVVNGPTADSLPTSQPYPDAGTRGRGDTEKAPAPTRRGGWNGVRNGTNGPLEGWINGPVNR